LKKTALLTVLLLVSALVLLTSCGTTISPAGEVSPAAPSEAQPAASTPPVSEAPPAAEQAAVALCPAALEIAAGRSITLAAEPDDSQAAEWASSNTDAVSVNQDGTITALSAGEAMVTVSSGASSASCRVIVRDTGMTLAYREDPGPVGRSGGGASDENAADNFPVLIPDDRSAVDKDMFEDAEYAWQFLIDDGFDTNLKVPGTGISYIANYHIILDAGKAGGDSVMGDYEGTMKMEMAMDEASYISAMKAQDIPVTDVNFAMQTQDVTLLFKVVTYDLDTISAAKYAFAPDGAVPVVPLVQIPAMAVSSAETSTSGSIDIEAEEGYGGGSITGEAGQITYVIEVHGDGEAALYLPKMLALCDNNRFVGKLLRIRLLDLPE
jgi:predicted small secreted protein